MHYSFVESGRFALLPFFAFSSGAFYASPLFANLRIYDDSSTVMTMTPPMASVIVAAPSKFRSI
jgi:hypothetical protein